MYAAPGPYPVGTGWLDLGESPAGVTLWYPAAPDTDTRLGTTYTFAIRMLAPRGGVAIATYAGIASVNAPPDTARGPFPLVILSPGFAISTGAYAWLAEHLASYGLVVVAPDYEEVLDPANLWMATIDRPRATSTLLGLVDDAARTGSLRGLVDPERVAVIGHSYGGYTALASAGARMDTTQLESICEQAYRSDDPVVFLCEALLPRLGDMAVRAGLQVSPEGLWPESGLPGVDAVVALAGDAVMFGEGGLREIEVPVLAIGGTADRDSPFAWGTQLTYESVRSPRRVEIGLVDAEHMVFTGPCERARLLLRLLAEPFCADPAWDKVAAHQLVQHFATAFLLAELNHDAAATAALSSADGFEAISYRAGGY